MSLKDITKKIINDAQEEAEKVIKESKKDEEKIIAEKNKEIIDTVEKLKHNGQASAEKLREQAEFKKRMIKKNTTLKAKQELIDEAFALAEKKLHELNNTAYKGLMVCMLKNSPAVPGALVITAAQKKDIMAKAVKETGFDYEFSPKSLRSGQGGFILCSDTVEVNNTISNMVKSRREEIETVVAGILFG